MIHFSLLGLFLYIKYIIAIIIVTYKNILQPQALITKQNIEDALLTPEYAKCSYINNYIII